MFLAWSWLRCKNKSFKSDFHSLVNEPNSFVNLTISACWNLTEFMVYNAIVHVSLLVAWVLFIKCLLISWVDLVYIPDALTVVVGSACRFHLHKTHNGSDTLFVALCPAFTLIAMAWHHLLNVKEAIMAPIRRHL